MRLRSGVTAGLVVATLLAGCGGDDGDDAGPTTAASAPGTRPSRLERRLLDVGDLPQGWQVGPALNAMDLASFAFVPCEDARPDPAVVARLTATAGIQFEPVDGSSKHLIQLVATGPPEQLDADMNALLDAVAACASSLSTRTDDPWQSVEELPLPSLGDRRAAYTATGTGPTPTYGQSGYVVDGSTAVFLGSTDILATPQTQPAISDAQYVDLLQTAVDELKR